MFSFPAFIRLCSLSLLSLFFSLPNSYSQVSPCNCRKSLDEVIDKVVTNYPGYTFKVTPENNVQFQKFTADLRKKADTTSFNACFPILTEWVSFFKDRHLNILFKDSRDNIDLIKNAFADAERFDISRDSLLKSWIASPPTSIEGIYKTGELYEVAVIKKDKEFIGVITRGDNLFWIPGQIKFKLTPGNGTLWKGILYNRQHVPDSFVTHIDSQASISLRGSRWDRLYPQPATKTQMIPIDSFYFAKLDSLTTILRLPSFDLKYKYLIDSLITNNLGTITKTPHLIIDVRGNLGGYNVCFEKLLPIIYTNTITIPGTVFKATPDNIALYKQLIENKGFPEKNKPEFCQLIRDLNKNKNKDYLVPEADINFPEVYHQPEKVAFLIDQGSASATEFLILNAKQSKKVTMFGMRSAGILDYSNVVAPRSLSCPGLELWCPSARSARLPLYPIDNIGISPDIELSLKDNWVNYVQQYFANHGVRIVTTTK